MSNYDSTQDTISHSTRVNTLMQHLLNIMSSRGETHDYSKLIPPEKSLFDEYSPKLKSSTYGSDEYKANLEGLKVALDHHYKENSHHPEHYENGINGMDLVDLVEMICDWKAASERHADGNIHKSISINADRFKLSPQLVDILVNTVERYFM